MKEGKKEKEYAKAENFIAHIGYRSIGPVLWYCKLSRDASTRRGLSNPSPGY
jgi:hypothetical protein